MEKRALQQARERLATAEEAYTKMQSASSVIQMEAAWHQLLTAAGAIYTKLEKGVKLTGRSQSWFAKQKKQRKDDELLQYAHQARNSSEHSVDNVVQRQEWSVSMTGLQPGEFFGVREGPGGVMFPVTNADPKKLESRGREMTLLPVRNRGVIYPVPTQHLGQSLISNTPNTVGDLLIQHLKAMVRDAESLV
jgi:hypothetical protein